MGKEEMAGSDDLLRLLCRCRDPHHQFVARLPGLHIRLPGKCSVVRILLRVGNHERQLHRAVQGDEIYGVARNTAPRNFGRDRRMPIVNRYRQY